MPHRQQIVKTDGKSISTWIHAHLFSNGCTVPEPFIPIYRYLHCTISVRQEDDWTWIFWNVHLRNGVDGIHDFDGNRCKQWYCVR